MKKIILILTLLLGIGFILAGCGTAVEVSPDKEQPGDNQISPPALPAEDNQPNNLQPPALPEE